MLLNEYTLVSLARCLGAMSRNNLPLDLPRSDSEQDQASIPRNKDKNVKEAIELRQKPATNGDLIDLQINHEFAGNNIRTLEKEVAKLNASVALIQFELDLAQSRLKLEAKENEKLEDQYELLTKDISALDSIHNYNRESIQMLQKEVRKLSTPWYAPMLDKGRQSITLFMCNISKKLHKIADRVDPLPF